MAVRLSDVDAICLENGAKLLGWLERFKYFSPKKVEISRNTNERFTIKIYTDSCVYRITATKTYLGCNVSMRRPRPGETWTRGNDLPDGEFNEVTFHKILGAIIFYDARDVVKDRVQVPAEAKIPRPESSQHVTEEVEGYKFNESDFELRKPVVE